MPAAKTLQDDGRCMKCGEIRYGREGRVDAANRRPDTADTSTVAIPPSSAPLSSERLKHAYELRLPVYCLPARVDDKHALGVHIKPAFII
jgi:hypothetical protein